MKNRELVRETKWSRTYCVGPKRFEYESKFFADKITIDPEILRDEWATLSTKERRDFAFAFQAKDRFSSDEIRLLEFLAQQNDESIWRSICLALCRACDRGAAIGFITNMLRDSVGMKSNYYQAAGILNDPIFVPILENDLQKINHRLNLVREPDVIPLHLELLQLANALWIITGKSDYREVTERLAEHPSEVVRNSARLFKRQH